MSRRKKLYEGKAKIIYEGPEPNTVIQYFKDDATAFNAEKKGSISGKGVLNNRISAHIFEHLNALNIPTHFIKRVNMREQLVKKVEIVPVEVIVRNIVAGSMAKRLGVEEGTALPRCIVEFSYKSDELGDPLIADEHAIALGWASEDELDQMVSMALRINDILSGICIGIGIRLVDFKIEFGRWFDGEQEFLILADEISPDTCRFWDLKTNEKLDKDRFRRDLGGVEDAYQEIARRLGVLPKNLEGGDDNGGDDDGGDTDGDKPSNVRSIR